MSDLNYDAGWKGLELRSYVDDPECSSFGAFSGGLIPRSEWVERIDLLNAAQASPEHAWKNGGLKAMSQGSTSFGWAWSVRTGMCAMLAQQGIDPPPALNPFALACILQSGRNRGGYSTQAARGVQKYGMCTFDVWKHGDWNYKTNMKKKSVLESADLHKLVDFEEVRREGSFDTTMSALLQGYPVAVCLGWWRHAVCAMRPIYKGSKSNPTFGYRIQNSWGAWGKHKDGFSELWGSKAVPHDAVVIRSVKARGENP